MEPRPRISPPTRVDGPSGERDRTNGNGNGNGNASADADASATLSAGPRLNEAPTPPDDASQATLRDDRYADRTLRAATSPSPTPSQPPGAASGLRPADRESFVVEGEHARGGLGRVLRARDPSLDRPVALKEVLRSDPATIARFVREARITARLQHPNIVPVYEAGRWPSGEPFYAMRFISGRSLGAVVKETRALEDRLSLVPNLVAVADAVAYAHSVGVIHRDLKPDNVLLGAFGETVVIDWGLAKDLAAGEDEALAFGSAGLTTEGALTVAGSRVGTPSYMAPEQARGEAVDERADVWALGAMMYTVLTGEPPFAGKSADAILALAASASPVDVEVKAPGVPRDLATIVRKALARAPRDRYPTARELADDLRRFQTGQLVSARRYSRFSLVGRWLARHRVAVTIAAASLTALSITMVASVRRVVREKTRAEARTGELILAQAKLSLDRDPTASVAWLKSYPEGGPGWADARITADDARGLGVARHAFVLPSANTSSEVLFEDGDHVAVLAEGRLMRWELGAARLLTDLAVDSMRPATFVPGTRGVVITKNEGELDLLPSAGGPGRRLEVVKGPVGAVAASSDGRFIAAAGASSLVVAATAGDVRRAMDPPPSTALTLALSPDGSHLAAGTDDRSAWLWDVATGRATKLEGRLAKPAPITFLGDGSRLASAGDDGSIRIWSVPSGAASTLRGHAREALVMEASRDGSRLASADAADEVRLWDVASGESRVLGAHRGRVLGLRFSPDGSVLASTAQDETLRLFAVASGESRALHGHGGVDRALAFSPDGRLVATGGGGQVRVWEARMPAGHTLRGHDARVTNVAFSPDGTLVATCGGHEVRIWEAATGKLVRRGEHEAEAYGLVFSPDGRFVVSGSMDATARIWEVRGEGVRVLRGHDGRVRDAIFSPDGSSIATGGRDGTVRLWDVATGAARVLGKHDGQVTRVLFSLDGKRLVSTGYDRTVRLWDLAGSGSRVLGTLDGIPYQTDFLGRSERLVVASNEDVRILDPATGRWTALPRTADLSGRVAVASDGSFLAIPAGEQILIYDVAGGATRVLRGHDRPIQRCRISPDGKRIVSVSFDGSVRVWDVKSGAVHVIHRHEGVVFDAAFSPDGRLVATAAVDHTAWVGPADEGEADALLPDAASVRAALQRWTSAAVGDDNRPRTP